MGKGVLTNDIISPREIIIRMQISLFRQQRKREREREREREKIRKNHFRCLSHPFFRDANPRGCTPLFDRAGSRSTNATRCPWCMEHDTSMARRHRNSIVHRHLLRSALLQRHHYLVLLLPFQFTRGEFSDFSITDRFDR